MLWLAGVALRLTVLAVPPVVPQLHAELELSETEIAVLGGLLSLLFAAAAIPGSLLIARLGAVTALVIGLLINGIGSVARAAAPGVLALDAATIVMGLGIAIMQPALPPLVRDWFPQRIGFATAVYTNGLLVGEFVIVAITIPFVLPLVGGSWRWDFVVWALPVLATAALVVVAAPRQKRAFTGALPSPRRWWPDWRQPLIWRLGLILGSENSMYFGSNNFLPDYLTAAGRPDLISAGLTALSFSQLPASLLMLALAGRLARRPSAYVATGAVALVSLVGMMAAGGMWIVVWAGILGFANAVILVLALALPSLLSRPDDVHRTSAAMFTISYSCAVVIPIVGGALWDLTGQPVGALVPLAFAAILIVALAGTLDFKPEGGGDESVPFVDREPVAQLSASGSSVQRS
jgi:CP family cyanate transporter-like MFS transporter